MNIIGNNFSVSEIMGSMILLVLSITFFSVVYVSLLSEVPLEKTTLVSISATIEGNSIVITHKGGYSLSMETIVVINISENKLEFTAGELLNAESQINRCWNIGERLVYSTHDLTGKIVEVTVVDPFTEDTLFMGILKHN